MNQTSSSPAGDESSIMIIIASGGIGAICFGLADLLNNHDAAAVIKLGEALKPIAPSWLAKVRRKSRCLRPNDFSMRRKTAP